MKNKIATSIALAALPLFFALSDEARADCQSSCLADFPDACYNIKDYHWSKSDDGIAHVRIRNMGSFGGAFEWALSEINEPHVGLRPRLHLKAVTSGGDVKIHDIDNLCLDGYCGFWGLARTKRSGNHTTRANIWLAKDEMNENTHAKDLLVRKLTMVHELLHTMGLNHACVNDNHVMWPCGMPDKDYEHTPYMTSCDVKGLVALYGKRTESSEADASAENLLTNGSFEAEIGSEEGPWGGWARAKPDEDDRVRRSDDARVKGSLGLLVEAKTESAFVGAYQALSAEPNVHYRIEAKVRRHSGNADQCIWAQFLSWQSGQPEVVKSAKKVAGSSQNWHGVALDVTAPHGTEGVGIYVGNCETGSSVYHWDAIRMTEQ